MQHVSEVADAFIRACRTEVKGAPVFDLAGEDTTMFEVMQAIKRFVPESEITIGDTEVPFVSGLNDSGLRELIGDWTHVSLKEGVEKTVTAFRILLQRGYLKSEDAYLTVLGEGHDSTYDS